MRKQRKPQKITAVFILLLLIVFNLSCMAPAASEIAAPEEPMIPNTGGEATPIAAMASLKIGSETRPDGSAKNIASLSINSLGIGTLELDTPKGLDIHETALVKLTLSPEDAFTNLPKAPDPNMEDDLPANALRYTEQIDIYPVMNAELIGSGFDISANGSPQKVILSNAPVEWMWSIKPKETGTHSLHVVISIPVVIDEQRNILSTHVLQNIPVRIEVTETFGSKLAGALPWLIPTVVTVIGGITGFVLNARRKR